MREKLAKRVSDRQNLNMRVEAAGYHGLDPVLSQIESIKIDHALVRERAKHGFRWAKWGANNFGGSPGLNKADRGYFRAPFTFKGLISDQHPLLQFFSTKTNQAGYSKGRARLKTGNHKNEVFPMTRKVLGLDDAYVCVNSAMRGVIRIDIDATFPSGAKELLQLIASCGVPAPNFITGHEKSGELINPHLIWLLYDSVCWTNNGRKRPKQMFQTIEAALTYKLLPLGADANALVNPLRMKNPLSPLWSTYVVAEAPFRLNRLAPRAGQDPYGLPILTEALGIGEVKAGEQLVDDAWALRRRICRVDEEMIDVASDGTGHLPSNHLFALIRKKVGTLVRQYRTQSYSSDTAGRSKHKIDEASMRRACERAVEAATPGWSERTNMPLDLVRSRAIECFDYLWEHFDPTKVSTDPRPLRGALKTKCHGLDLHERQAIGGKDVAARRRRVTLARLGEAYNKLSSNTTERPTMGAIAAQAGVSRATAYNVGLPTIISAARSAANRSVLATKQMGQITSDNTNSLFAQTSPRRCLVKRETPTSDCEDNNPFYLPLFNSAKPVIVGENDDASTFINPADRRRSYSARPYPAYMERQAAADRRIHTTLDRAARPKIQHSLFLDEDFGSSVGPALYHYLSSKRPGQVIMKVINTS